MIALAAISYLLFSPFGIDQTGSDAYASLRGTVRGQLIDGTRPTIPYALVTAHSDADVEQTRADARGEYLFLSLLPGVYRIDAQAQGPYVAGACYPDRSSAELSAGVEYAADIVVINSCK